MAFSIMINISMPVMSRTTVDARKPLFETVYEAIIVNHLDPKYMGGLQVELLKATTAGNLPERTGQILEVRYLSPFYGVTPVAGLNTNDGYENTQKSYGFWMVPPDVGSRVLVIFAEHNPAQGFWIGCIQDEYMNFMVPNPYASTTLVTDPPDNLKNKKIPVAEYNKTRVKSNNRPTGHKKPHHKELVNNLIESGLIGDDIRGTSSSSARREVPSNVYGFSTPGPVDKRSGQPKADIGPFEHRARVFVNRLGGHSLVMDDGNDNLLRKGPAKNTASEYINPADTRPTDQNVVIPHNECMRFKTRTGHQLLFHNSEDLIYVSNSRGTVWVELTSNGKIDIFTNDSISAHTMQDINFTAERDINFTAMQNINMSAGKYIRAFSNDDTTFLSNSNFVIDTENNMSLSSNIFNQRAVSVKMQATNDLNIKGVDTKIEKAGQLIRFETHDVLNADPESHLHRN